MTRHATARMLPWIIGAALLGAATATPGAPLDLNADAVVGKPNFTTAAGGAASATNLVGSSTAAEDPITGAMWVSDETGSRVLRFASAAAFANGEAANLVLGQADFTSTLENRGGSPAANTLRTPGGVAVDQGGRLYVADIGNSRVVVYRPPFTTGMDASWVIGQPDFSSFSCNRGGAPAANTLCAPIGIAFDRTGNLFVGDSSNNRILRFAAPAVTGAVANKVFGQGNSFTTGAASTTATGLSYPLQVTVDRADNLWATELLGNRVLRYDLGASSGDTTADLVLCQALFTTNSGGTSSSTCNGAAGVSVDLEGVVYVSDIFNSRVLRFTTLANGAAATGVIGQASFLSGTCNRGFAAPTADTLCNPYMLFHDRAGNLLVSDGANNRLLRYDLPRNRVAPTLATLSPESVPRGSGTFTLTVNGGDFYGVSVVNWNGAPRATQFVSGKRLLALIPAADVAGAGPYSVTVTNPAPGGGTSSPINFTPYTRAALDATADRVLFQPGFTSAVTRNPQVGEEQVGATNAANAVVGAVISVAVDRVSGRFFVVEVGNAHRVLSWPSVAAFHNAQAADVILGQPDEFTAGCNTGGVSASSLCSPYSLAVDPTGALYVSDRLNNRVLRYAPPFVTGMAASTVFGQGGSFTTGSANNGGLGANSLSGPVAVAVNGGALFVWDSGNARLLVYNNPAADMTADVVIGQPNMTSAVGEPASATRFGTVDSGLALDSAGRLFFAVSSQNRILRFSPPFANGMAADLVIGQPGFVSTGSATSASGLSTPIGLALDPADSLLVAEFGNHRVLRYAAPLSSAMAATGVLGQGDFVTATSGLSATKFNRPAGVAFDAVGNLVVTDLTNGRVLGFDRPFAFPLDPATDLDRDGIPNGVEVTESRDPYAKDNAIFTVNRLFAMQQYRDFLGREGDAGGITFYTDLLASGTLARANVVENFFNSPEFAGTVSPIVRLYFATFLRIPDYAGLQFQVDAFRAGAPLTVIANNFTLSPEFIATYGALTNPQYVTLLYQNILNRTPVQAEIDFHVARLTSGVTRGEVLVGFSESPEYQANTFNEVYVTMMYVGMLRRAPEQAGFDFWLNYMDTGNPGINLILGFLNAPEYYNRFLP